jgi:Asp-tRNA(Asn)/Glu-tRNA(Gln) amidotransferase A subunit family amidase
MPVQALSENGVQKAIAVPSRLYSPVTSSKPLAGLRVSIKDNIDLCGMKTTLMNCAYTELYPPQQSSAPFVKDLIAKGAVIVGKTTLCSFASADEPTDQWIDYLCAYNPRGDQYQSPSGSTAGGAASLAGFHWLDYSIETYSMQTLQENKIPTYVSSNWKH